MVKKLLWTAALCLLVESGYCQTNTKNYRNFPVIVSLQFQSLAVPFHDLKSNFSNIGLGIGTEVSYNGKSNWIQQLSMVWYHNREIGNGLLLYTQPVWRPTLGANIFTEVKLGAGYLLGLRPVESYKQADGNWVSVGKKGKGMFTIPLGISIGYEKYSTRTYISPFASYQVLFVSGYNQSIPLVPESLIQIGSRIHLKY